MIFHLLLVSCGGFLGSIARFWVANKWDGRAIGTWIANITGSILLAIICRLYFDEVISESMWLLFGVGYCGAYTTFSTFGKETLEFILEKKYSRAIQYVLSSFTLSLFIFGLIFI